MVIFSTFIWICIQTWNCTNKSILGKLYEKSNVLQFLDIDKLDFIFSCLIIWHNKFNWDQFMTTQKELDLKQLDSL